MSSLSSTEHTKSTLWHWYSLIFCWYSVCPISCWFYPTFWSSRKTWDKKTIHIVTQVFLFQISVSKNLYQTTCLKMYKTCINPSQNGAFSCVRREYWCWMYSAGRISANFSPTYNIRHPNIVIVANYVNPPKDVNVYLMTLHWMYIVQLVFRGAQPKFFDWLYFFSQIEGRDSI